MFEKGVVSLPIQRKISSSFRILIIHTRWNREIVSALCEGAIATLKTSYGISAENITVQTVPGAFELPFAVKSLAMKQKYDAIIPIGVLIKGGTMHFEYISEAVSNGLMNVGLEIGVPVIFGVLTCITEEQAMERAGIGKGAVKGHNHGVDWAAAAVEMAILNLDKQS